MLKPKEKTVKPVTEAVTFRLERTIRIQFNNMCNAIPVSESEAIRQLITAFTKKEI